jgi:hypothetical protein
MHSCVRRQIGVIVVLPRTEIPRSWPASLQARSLGEDKNRSCRACTGRAVEHDDRALLLPLQPEVATCIKLGFTSFAKRRGSMMY